MLNWIKAHTTGENESPKPSTNGKLHTEHAAVTVEAGIDTSSNQYQVFRRKLDGLLERGRIEAVPTVSRILEEATSIEDFLVPVSDADMSINVVGGELTLTTAGFEPKRFTDHSLRQFGERIGVINPGDARTYAKGDRWMQDVATNIYTAHIENKPPNKPVMVRVVGDTIKAVVSNSYGRFDSAAILDQFVKVASGNNAQITRADLTQNRWYLEMLRPEIVNIDTPRNGNVPAVFGASLSNSDYGTGSVELRLFVLNLICLNGMVGQSLIRSVHIGSEIKANDELLSTETIRKRTDYFTSSMRDILGNAFADAVIAKAVRNIENASSKIIDPQNELSRLVSASSIGKADSDAILHRLLTGGVADGIQGENTTWKLANAITAVARDLRSGNDVAYVNAKGATVPLTGGTEKARALESLAGDMVLEASLN